MSEFFTIIGLVAAVSAAAAKSHHLWFVTRPLNRPQKEALQSSIGDLRWARRTGLAALWVANAAAVSLPFFFYFRHPEYFTPGGDSKYSPEFQVLFLAAILSLAATFLFGGVLDFMIVRRLTAVEALKNYAATLKWNRLVFYLSLLVLFVLAFCMI